MDLSLFRDIAIRSLRPFMVRLFSRDLRKLFCPNVMGLPRARLLGSLQLNQRIPLVIRFCPNVSTLEIPYCPYPRVSHNVTLMTRLVSNNINRQPTVRFSSVSSMIIRPRWLLGRLPAPALALQPMRRRNSVHASAACRPRPRSRQQWSLRDVRVLYHERMR